MNYWLVKQEPATYSWDNLVRDGSTDWTGVRNFQARKHLASMKRDDQVLFYHSGKEKAVVGIATVTKPPYEDPTAREGNWIAVDIRPFRPLKKPVTLSAIRLEKALGEMALVRQSRLSVMPVTEDQFKKIVNLGSS
jgi:predicted RNA-binding protein with PUA-like domain